MKPFFRAARLATLSLLASASLYGASCSDGDTGTGGTAGGASLEDVIYEGETTDEALEGLLAATPQDVAAKKAIFDSPTDGGALPSTTIPTFSWHVGASTGFAPSAPFPWQRPAPSKARHALLDLGNLVGPIRAAHAHGAPFNGTGYFVVFSTAADAKLVRVFTANLTFKPDATAWKKLQDAGAPIDVSIISGIFDNNALASDGGPFKGEKITITVTK